MPPEAPFSRLHRVFGGLYRTGPYNLACRLGLEHHRLAVERVCALACFGRGLLDDDELCQSRNKKHAGLLEFLVTDVRERLQNALHVPLRQFALGSDFLYQLRLRHLDSHF